MRIFFVGVMLCNSPFFLPVTSFSLVQLFSEKGGVDVKKTKEQAKEVNPDKISDLDGFYCDKYSILSRECGQN